MSCASVFKQMEVLLSRWREGGEEGGDALEKMVCFQVGAISVCVRGSRSALCLWCNTTNKYKKFKDFFYVSGW